MTASTDSRSLPNRLPEKGELVHVRSRQWFSLKM